MTLIGDNNCYWNIVVDTIYFDFAKAFDVKSPKKSFNVRELMDQGFQERYQVVKLNGVKYFNK